MVYAIVSAKNLKLELTTSTIIGSQIINLQLCLGIPWLINNLMSGVLIFNDLAVFDSLFAIFIIVLVGLLFMIISRFKLTFCLGFQLILLYVGYVVFEVFNNYKKI